MVMHAQNHFSFLLLLFDTSKQYFSLVIKIGSLGMKVMVLMMATVPEAVMVGALVVRRLWSQRLNPSSRFELFSMFIGVTTSDFGKGFEAGELFGYITLSDTSELLSDGWLFRDKEGCGHVAHFLHDFDNSVGIRDTCFISFGNPGSRHDVSFSDSIKMGVHLSVTIKKKDDCYELCSCDYDIKLKDIWDGSESVKQNTFKVEGIYGCVSISYILIKDVVDTFWSLWYEPEPASGVPKLHGNIVAYYGDDNNMSHEALMFHREWGKLEKGILIHISGTRQ